MSIEWGLPTVCDILKGAVNLIKRPVKYAMSSKSFANDLREEVGKLENEARRGHGLAQVARNNRRILDGCFTDWQQRADKALEEARNLLDNFGKASKTCCYGTLPDPYCRYRFSTEAEAEIQVIRGLAQDCIRFRALDDICSINTASGNVTAPTLVRGDGKDAVQSTTATASVFSASTSIKDRNDGVFESRALMIRNIMDALANKSNRVVGVYGMGGIGKSTLLVDVERKIREGKSFDWVAKTDVSENPDIKTIQGEIADALGLTEIKEKETISGRARLLHDRLKDEEKEKKKVLIILDNLWKGLELNTVGIPCGHDNRVIGCKLLLTSRDRNVLRSKMGCDKDFPLGELQPDEARSLFERLVGDKVHDDEFKPLVDEALHKCFNLPFLIVHMAKVLRHAGLFEWKKVLKQIKLSKNEGIGEVINERLQLSYKNLRDTDKSLLALCVAYGTSKPSLENLVRYGVGWGLFPEDDNMEDARDSLKSGIHNLQASSLLLDDGDAYDFKIHDLVHEFVASVALRDHPLLILKDKSITELPEDKLKSCRAVCFLYVDMKELPQELDCPELEIFLLFTNNESPKVPNSLFHSMRKLMVLNLTGVQLTCSPSTPFQFLENLHTLCLDNCSLNNVAILGELKGLQILSFANSKIHRLPKEIGHLAKLRLLDLDNCLELEIIEPGVLRCLIKLEELYMNDSFNQWNVVEQTPPTNASLIELNHMKNLGILHVHILDPSMLPEDLNFQKLTKYEIQIGNKGFFWGECKGSRILKLQLDPLTNVLQKGCIQSILGKIDGLILNGLGKIERSDCAISQRGFPNLRILQVMNSPSMHYIHQSPSHIDFKTLEWLILRNLINLEKLCHNHISCKSFSALKVVRVNGCHKMEVLFPLSLLRGLPQLEKIKVLDCKRMRGIVDADYDGKVELHNLRVLDLCDLQDIKSFFDVGSTPLSSTLHNQVGTQIAFFNGQQVAFPNLENLYIKGMDNIEMIWHDQIPTDSFSKLKLLSVKECKKLVNVVPSFIQGRLLSLETLIAKACDSLEVVFKLQPLYHLDRDSVATNLVELSSDEGGKEGHVVAFNQLKYMKLDGLTRLRCFSSGGYTLMFPLLEDIIVNRCPKMKFFSKGPIEVPKLKGVRVDLNEVSTRYQYFWNGNLNTTIQKMFEEMVTFAGTKYMRLFEFPELIGKWHGILNPITSSWQLESLVVSKCPSFINAIPSSLMLVLKRMKSLQVRDCVLLEEIFDLEGLEVVGCTQVLPQLTYLYLVNLPKLRQLWNRDLQGMMCLNSLWHLSLYKCSNLRHAFAPSMARCLPNLQQMEIKECDQMEGVIADEEGQGSTVEKITFPNLRLITLECLPNLTNFLSWKNHTLECPILSKISIAHCLEMRSLTWQSSMEIDNGNPSLFTPQVQFPQLESMVFSHMDHLSKIWTNVPQETLTFDYLRKVKVQNCKSLENLFPHWVATSLTQLEKLQVQSCGIEEIVASGDDTPHSNATQILFPKLSSLVLHDMPRLQSFSPILPSLNWQFLEKLRVTHCDKLNMLSFAASMNSWAQRDDQQDLSNQEAHSSFERDFPKLDRLSLVYKNIQMMQDGKFLEDIFGKLKALTLACFHDKEAVFPPKFVLERLQNLRSLEIFCNSFEDIFPDEGLIDEEKHPVLENLRELKLNKLHNLKSVWREDFLVSKTLQSIETFKVWDCPRLTTIFPAVTSFQNLTELVVKNCSGLLHLVTALAVTNLIHLNRMTIIGCERMEEVVTNDGNRERKMISFGNLRYLTLQHLPSLECFFSIPSCFFRLPSLFKIEVEDCPKMKTFSKGILSTPKLQLVTLFRYEWVGAWEGRDLNTTIQKLSDKCT